LKLCLRIKLQKSRGKTVERKKKRQVPNIKRKISNRDPQSKRNKRRGENLFQRRIREDQFVGMGEALTNRTT
jgi:hypothetical protein